MYDIILCHTIQQEKHDPLVHDLQRLLDQLMVLSPDAAPTPPPSPLPEVVLKEHTSGQCPLDTHHTVVSLSP